MVTQVDGTADEGWRAVLEEVRAAVRAAGEDDPLDEAARLRVKHRGLAESTLWLAGTDGFAAYLPTVSPYTPLPLDRITKQ